MVPSTWTQGGTVSRRLSHLAIVQKKQGKSFAFALVFIEFHLTIFFTATDDDTYVCYLPGVGMHLIFTPSQFEITEAHKSNTVEKGEIGYAFVYDIWYDGSIECIGKDGITLKYWSQDETKHTIHELKSEVDDGTATYNRGNRKRKKRTSCKECPNCLADDCKECVNCLDMKKYGGKGKKKKGCLKKKCEFMHY